MEELGLGQQIGVAQALPGAEGEVVGGGIRFAALVQEPTGEGLAEFVGDFFEFLFLAGLVGGEGGGGGLLLGEEAGDGGHAEPEFRRFGGEGCGTLGLPVERNFRGIQDPDDGVVHVVTVCEYVLHDGFGARRIFARASNSSDDGFRDDEI